MGKYGNQRSWGRDAAAAELERDDTLRGTGFSAKDVANAAELTGTGMRLDLVPGGSLQ